MSTGGQGQVKEKVKTKAKARYLKKKKERRKQRKTVHQSTGTTNAAPSLKRSLNESDDSDEEDQEDQATQLPVSEKSEDRSRKKQKVQSDEEEVTKESGLESVEDEDEPIEEEIVTAHREPSPQAALPSFPLPVAPDAPSKEVLALQGLDKHLLEAELVDATRTLPLDDSDLVDRDFPSLSEKTKKRLKELGITEFFAVQTVLLPFLLPKHRQQRSIYCPYESLRDVCASAPTGSGKTLSYVIPIIEMLSSRISTKLRALVVLPTRDLVTQVQETFEAVGKGRGLKIGITTGQHSFAHEQSQLVTEQDKILHGGSSKVDILICTPGRLIDHLAGTPNFTLQHLRFLVIDEADRLLAQSFQDWLAQVSKALRPPSRLPLSTNQDSESNKALRHDALAPSWFLSTNETFDFRSDLDDQREISCQKLLFSATLTRDPSKIAAIGLRNPKYFVVQAKSEREAIASEEFAMPDSLLEHMLICSSTQKPLHLFYLLHAQKVANALVFTKSADSTTRLVHLFNFFEEAWSSSEPNSRPVIVRAYSSDLPNSERRALLDQFKEKKIDILVCSDLISRGIDISNVSHVVSYDAPVDMRKYVHRVGRTARAGRSGDAWTLVEEQEARFFKTMMREANHLDRIKKVKVTEKDLQPFTEYYGIALDRLRLSYSKTAS